MSDGAILNIIFLPAVVLLGVVTSWEDYHTGKIRNRWLMLGLYYGLAVFSVLLIWDIIANPVMQYYYTNLKGIGINDPRPVFSVRHEYFVNVVANSSVALACGYALWRYGLLAAGDAKLIFVFAFLLPLSNYWKSYLPVFPSLALLINIFIPALIYIILVSVKCLLLDFFEKIKNRKKEKIKKEIQLKLLFAKIPELVMLFAVFMFIMVSMDTLRTYVSPIIMILVPHEAYVFLLLFLLYRPFFAFFKKHKSLPYVALAGLAVYIYWLFSTLGQSAWDKLFRLGMNVIVFLSLFRTLTYVLDNYFTKAGQEAVLVEKLMPGMSIATQMNSDIGVVTGAGIDQEQLGLIKKWADGKKINELNIYRKFPFALWVFIGVILTIIARGSILKLILF